MRYFSFVLVTSVAILPFFSAHAHKPSELAYLKKKVSDLQKQIDQLSTQQNNQSLSYSGNTPPPVRNGDKNVSVRLSGQINRMAAYRDNGKTSRIEHLDSSASSSRFNITGEAKLTPEIKAQSILEMEWLENPSNTTPIAGGNTEFNTPNSSDNLRPRRIEGILTHEKIGTLFVGKGSTAVYENAVDLSGTSAVNFGSEGAMNLGGFHFYNKTTNTLEPIAASNLIENYAGIRRTNRIRYDTPTFYGFRLSIDHNNQDITDAGLRFDGTIQGTKLTTAIGAVNASSYGKVDSPARNELSNLKFRQYNSSFSVLFPTGISISAAGGVRDFRLPTSTVQRNRGTFWSTKLGYQKNWFSFGNSAFSIDYAQGKAQRSDITTAAGSASRFSGNFAAINSELVKSYGVTFVQNVDRLATELYLTFRCYDFSRKEDYTASTPLLKAGDFDKAHVIALGTRIKF